MCRRENQASSPPLEIQVHLLSLLTFLSAVACILPGFSELKHWPLVPSRWDSDISEHAEKKIEEAFIKEMDYIMPQRGGRVGALQNAV